MILRWLLPIGFVGLLAIALLLVIYLFRPQYREKRISATVIWKRVVLHTKKQRLRLTNIFIFLVQAMVLAIIAIGFAEPRLYSKKTVSLDSEYVVILDSSASMRAKSSASGDTRFRRAVVSATDEIKKFFSETENGAVSVILADSKPSYLFLNLKKDNESEIYSRLEGAECSLEEGNLEDAIALAGKHLEENPYAKIFFYTDTQFDNLGTAVEVVNVCDREFEQNIAILGCTVGIVDNQYAFEIVLGAYGNVTRKCNVTVDITGAYNGKEERDFQLKVPVNFAVDASKQSLEQIQRVTVMATNESYGGQPDWFFESYRETKISISDLNDSIADDDEFYVYGGIRDTIKIQYWSERSNNFWQFGFENLAVNMDKSRDIEFREIYQNQGNTAQNYGFDFYIFEHSIPSEILEVGLPTDGVVLLVDPNNTLDSSKIGLSFNQTVNIPLTACVGGEYHQLLQYIEPSRIHLTQYSQITVEDESFKPLLFVNGDPVMFVKNTPSSKVVVLPFSINMSDFYGDQFQIFLYNLVNYFMPRTLNKFDFNLGEKTQFNCKGESIKVEHDGQVQNFVEFPSELSFEDVGTYTFTTTFGLNKEDEVRRVYVHVSTVESNLFAMSDFHINLNGKELIEEDIGKDFFIWLAILSLILMVFEWYLQFKYIL